MGRELKRVPLDFEWPIDKVWEGYLAPASLDGEECPACEGSGSSPEAKALHERWYGYIPFHPSETGSTPLTVETPEVRAFAERNVASAPHYYGSSEAAIVGEAQRLADLWNGSWSHHLEQEDVDALIEAGRLMDFTHTWTKEDRWQPRVPAPTVTADMVNRWSLSGLAHDSINCWTVISAKCAREGVDPTCRTCGGHGSLERYPGQRAEAEAWERTEPPTGEGWQVWETVSEGSPITPVFATADDLIEHLVNVGAWRKRWQRAAAESFVKGSGWAPTAMVVGGTHHTPESMPT